MCERTVFKIGVHLLDDRVLPVGFIGRDGVQGAGREERVEPVRVEEGRLPGALERIQFWNPANDQAPGDAFSEPPQAERRELYFGDFGGGDPFPGGFVPDRVGVLNRRTRIICDGRAGAFHGGEDVADELACPAGDPAAPLRSRAPMMIGAEAGWTRCRSTRAIRAPRSARNRSRASGNRGPP